MGWSYFPIGIVCPVISEEPEFLNDLRHLISRNEARFSKRTNNTVLPGEIFYFGKKLNGFRERFPDRERSMVLEQAGILLPERFGCANGKRVRAEGLIGNHIN